MEKLKPYTSKGGWLLGDGSQIYICDFFVGSVYTDVINNPKSNFTWAEREVLMRNAPEFTAFGKRFE